MGNVLKAESSHLSGSEIKLVRLAEFYDVRKENRKSKATNGMGSVSETREMTDFATIWTY